MILNITFHRKSKPLWIISATLFLQSSIGPKSICFSKSFSTDSQMSFGSVPHQTQIKYKEKQFPRMFSVRILCLPLHIIMIVSSAFYTEIFLDQLKDLFLLSIKTNFKYLLKSGLLSPAEKYAITLCMILDCSDCAPPYYTLLIIGMLC